MPAAAPILRRRIGRLPQNLAAAGVSPAAIDAVVITHPHPDHIPGVHHQRRQDAVSERDTLRQRERPRVLDFGRYSRQGAGRVPWFLRSWPSMAIKPYAAAGKLSLYKDGAEFAPGVRAVACYGHTVGHSMVRVSPPGGDFLIFGDIVHCLALQFPDPERSVAFDTDPPAGARQPQARSRHGGDRSPAVLRRRTCRSRRSATPPNPAAAMLFVPLIYSSEV